MPRITFEYVNDLALFTRSALPPGQSRRNRAQALDGISRRAQQLEGFLSQNMLHDTHWDILRIGNYIERADMTTRIIDVRSADLIAGDHALEPFQDIQWRSVLRSFYAMQAYHASVREPVEPALVLEFLFKDPRLPPLVPALPERRRTIAQGTAAQRTGSGGLHEGDHRAARD